MSKLQLYLKGVLFQQTNIEIPARQELSEDEHKNFELNCRMRQELIEAEATKFKLQWYKQIIKCGYDYEIYLVVESNKEEPIIF